MATTSSKRKKLLWAIAVVFILTAIGAGVWYYLQSQQQGSPVKDRPLTKQEKLNTELIHSTTTGTKEESDAALESAVAAASNDEDRAQIYLDRASYNYYVDNVTDEKKQLALADAEKAYDLHASASAAKMILDIAHDLKRQDLIDKYQPIFDGYMKNVKDLNEGAQE